ncbi:MAG: cysteine hydrolase family protein [Actinomycetes bacterium]
MSTFDNRGKTGLLVIDVQNGVVERALNRDKVISNINLLVDKARASKTPVIWVQHSDDGLILESEEWHIVPELHPADSEPIVRKNYRSSFESTDLDQILEENGIDHLLITGAQTDFCVRHTSHAALERGYDITIIEDGHTTMDDPWDDGPIPSKTIIDELNRSFHNYQLPGRSSKIATAESIVF